MRRIPWMLIVLLGCGQNSTVVAPGGVLEAPEAVGEVAVVERAAESAPVPAGVDALSGIEEAQGWFREEWDMTTAPDISAMEHAGLGACLRLGLPGGEGDKSVAGLLISGSYPPAAGLRVDFVNRETRPLKAAVGLFLTPARVYYESPVLTLPPGYSTHTLPLDKPLWKSRSTGWRYETMPEGLDQAVQLDLLIYTSDKAVLLVPYLQPPVKPAPRPAEEKVLPAPEVTPGILTPEEEKRLKEKLTPEQKEEIRRLITTLEE